ncbi:MAG: glycosyltransferase family 9 protein [Bacteroidota bacterium]
MAKKADSKHILIIRLSAMGDVAMIVPVINALKRKYPDVKITLLTKPYFEAIFSEVEGLTVFPAYVKFHHKGVWGLWKLYKELNRFPITHIADVHNVIRSRILCAFFGLSNVPVKKINKGRNEKRMLTRSKNKGFKPLKSTIERYTDVINRLGFNVDIGKLDVLPKHKIPRQLLKFVGPNYDKIIGIAPFATYQSKMYRLDLMEQVIHQLISKKNNKVLLFGGGDKESEQLKALDSKFGDEVQAVAGELELKAELSLISNLDVMIAMDSGNGHLAANYGVPVLTIWGVTHPYAGFKPYNQPLENSLLPDRDTFPLLPTSVYGNKYPEGYLEAINSITPESILGKVQEILGEA